MSDIITLEARLRSRRRELDSLLGQKRSVMAQLEEFGNELVDLADNVIVYERVNSLLNSIGEHRQFAAQNAIEQLVTRGLQTIFDDSLSFHIIQDVKARRAEVSFIVRTTLLDGTKVDTDVLNARGGGLAATVGFLLRLVVLLLRYDGKRDILMVLDETFAHVSAEYVEGVRDFIRQVVDKTGIQVLMVTHQPEFAEAADKVYRLSIKNGKTVVQEG